MFQPNPKADAYFENARKWQEELIKLREIVSDCPVTEELKWRVPCYTFQNANVVLIHAFKDYCALLFMKGALLKDEEGILFQQTENVQSGRQIRFTSATEIEALKPILKAYIFEAIEVEKAGLKIEHKKTEDFVVVEELQQKFDENPEFKTAFESLTPGRQRAYLLHFSQAQQPKTRFTRIEKYTSRILKGKGLTDCVCGHSKKMPNCDGSHKYYRVER